jgi:hypothetical protein
MEMEIIDAEAALPARSTASSGLSPGRQHMIPLRRPRPQRRSIGLVFAALLVVGYSASRMAYGAAHVPAPQLAAADGDAWDPACAAAALAYVAGVDISTSHARDTPRPT